MGRWGNIRGGMVPASEKNSNIGKGNEGGKRVWEGNTTSSSGENQGGERGKGVEG